MKTIDLATEAHELLTAVEQIQAGGEVAVLTLAGRMCGLLLPAQEAQRLAAHYTPRRDSSVPAAGPAEPHDYLELLRDEPALVPLADGVPLEFVTMMNSSYINPEQLYQFKHPVTRQIYLYRASELQQAIGRTFAPVEFIPQNPKAFVNRKP